ncbi:MAG: ACP S-malonyltransferase [Myxococcales bacterium]|nr:ACP S-malonyltransferase [Myxococcales bacterium]
MLAFIFPGQGSQRVGMGRDLIERFEVARRTFEEANDALGFDLRQMCLEGPEEALKLTENAQPAILACSVAALRALRENTALSPSYVAGHSLGEYSALVAADALSLGDALRLVRERGRLMQQAVPAGVGGMAALMGLDADGARELCRAAAEEQVLELANDNGGGQIVIAGHSEALGRARGLAKAQRARCIPLKVSAPFHSSLMQPAADKLAERLAEIAWQDCKLPVIGNVEAEPYSEAGRIAALLEQQMTAPVRWRASVQKMRDLGVNRFVEVGPGAVLAGLLRRIDKDIDVSSVETPEHIVALAA